MMSSAQRNFLTGSFNPMSLSPALWLSDTGSDPAVWSDISGNGRNGVQPTPNAQPAIVTNGLNGRQVRRFDGVDDFMTHGLSGSLSGSFSIFIVTKLIALGSGYRTLFTCGDAAQGSILIAKSGVTGRWGTYTSTDASATSTLITGQTVLLEMIDSAAAGGAFFLNGISNGVWSGNTVGQSSANIGGSPSISQQTNCDIAEIIVFPTALSDPDRQKVEAYLRAKWDIPFNPLLLSPALWLSDTGSDPATWPDISGNGRNATAGVGQEPAIVANAINGRQVRRFDGVNDFLQSATSLSTTQASIFVVSQCTDTAVSNRVIFQAGINSANASVGLSLHTNRARKAFIYGNEDLIGSPTVNVTTMACVLSASGLTYYQDGIPISSISKTGISCNGGFTCGSLRDGSFSTFYKGDIAEILVFPTALSNTDRQNVEAYLKNKWMPDLNPLSLSPALWLSDTGSEPSVWPDISGNARNATQSDASRRPAIVADGLNGRQVRRFDGTDDFLSLTTGLGMLRNVPGATVIAVYKWIINPETNKSVFFASVNANAELSRLYLGGGVASRKLLIGGRRLDSDSFARCDSSANNTNSFFIHSGVVDYANSDLFQYVNGTLDGVNTSFQTSGNTSNTDSSLITVGTAGTSPTNCANVDIAEILVFPTALSDTNRQRVEAYLKNKWLPDFNPLSLSPALWLSDTGSDPAVWADISGNGRNATAGVGQEPAIVANAQNGRQVRRFNGVDDCLFYPDFHTANITIFAVYKPANNGNIQTLLRKGFTAGLSLEYVMRANNATTVLFGLPIVSASSTKTAGGNWIVQAGWADSSFVSSSVNGGSVTSVSGASAIPNNSFRGRIGSSYASESDTAGFAQLLLGDIAEILVFPYALSTTDRQAVESYLRTKWGTP